MGQNCGIGKDVGNCLGHITSCGVKHLHPMIVDRFDDTPEHFGGWIFSTECEIGKYSMPIQYFRKHEISQQYLTS